MKNLRVIAETLEQEALTILCQYRYVYRAALESEELLELARNHMKCWDEKEVRTLCEGVRRYASYYG